MTNADMRRSARKSRVDTSPVGASLKLVLPATSANIGPAFDSAALALKLHLKIEAALAREFSVTASGRDKEICSRLEGNLVLETYKEILKSEGASALMLSLKVSNEIPVGKGCGSSAAARLAGVALAVHFGDLRWSQERIMEEAAKREGHADNVAACWLGGFAVSQWQNTSQANHNQNGVPVFTGRGSGLHAYKVEMKKSWPLLLVIPAQPLSTEESRKALPAGITRFQAVANIQSAMLLAAAFAQGRGDLLSHALRDELHQPYRASLCPLLPELGELAGQKGVIGVVLSGAGPSVLLVLDPAVQLHQTMQLVAAHVRNHHREAELIPTGIETCGGAESMKAIRPKGRREGAKR